METSDFEKAMRELQEEYVLGLPVRVAEVEQEWHTLTEEGWNAKELGTLVRMAHNLAGSGATYGMRDVSRAAQALELYTKGLDANRLPADDVLAEVERHLAGLRACVGQH